MVGRYSVANNIDGQQELMPGAQKTQQPSNLAGNTGKQDRNTGLQILSDTLINGPYITLAVFRPPQPEKLPGIIHTNMAYAELLLHGRPVHGSPFSKTDMAKALNTPPEELASLTSSSRFQPPYAAGS